MLYISFFNSTEKHLKNGIILLFLKIRKSKIEKCRVCQTLILSIWKNKIWFIFRILKIQILKIKNESFLDF